MQQQRRYIIETNIERFGKLLCGGRLDAEQTRTVAALLAEAREELDQFDRRGTTTVYVSAGLHQDRDDTGKAVVTGTGTPAADHAP